MLDGGHVFKILATGRAVGSTNSDVRDHSRIREVREEERQILWAVVVRPSMLLWGSRSIREVGEDRVQGRNQALASCARRSLRPGRMRAKFDRDNKNISII